MKKKLNIAFALISVSLIAMVAFQLYWTVNAYQVNKKTFENKIDIAMQQALDSCKKHYFDSIRVMLVKRLSDTTQIKIKVDTALRFVDSKGPNYSYNIYINTNGNRMRVFTPNKTLPIKASPLADAVKKAVPSAGSTKGLSYFFSSNGNVVITQKTISDTTRKGLMIKKILSRLNDINRSNKTSPQTNIDNRNLYSLTTTSEDVIPPTISTDNKRWDFYKRMIKHPATIPEVITEMSFYLPGTMQSLYWVFAGADMGAPENKTQMIKVMAKYKGAARDSFFAHGGSLQVVGLGVVPDNYIKIEQFKLHKYFDMALKGQNINAPYRLNLAVQHAAIEPKEQSSTTTEQEYKYYGMRIFGLSANKPALYVQAIFRNSQYAVLKAMAFTLIASVLLILLTAAAFLYTIRIILAQKKLADLKDDFINNMTHELKTPIATITVAIEGLQTFNALNDPAKTQRYLQTSRNELNRLNDLVTKVLNMATFEDKEIEMVKEPVAIDDLVNEIIAVERSKAHKTVNITFLNKDQVTHVYADRLHFRNMINNLVDNAVKYSDNPVNIAVTCYCYHNLLKIAVKDDGIGIAPSNINLVFDKFYRVPTGNIHNVKGTGLGLSYVKYIAIAHGGNIEVKSELNKGTEFIVSLPLNNG